MSYPFHTLYIHLSVQWVSFIRHFISFGMDLFNGKAQSHFVTQYGRSQ